MLKREEQKLIREIKAAASKGNQAGAKTLAKQLIRIRSQMQRLTVHNAQMKGVSAQITVCWRYTKMHKVWTLGHSLLPPQTAAATATVGSTMASTSKVMAQMGKTLDPVKMQGTMQEFSMQNERMNMASEVMEDAIDSALDGDDVEDETEELMGQVLDEIGIDLSAAMGVAPGRKVAAAPVEEEEDVTARLAALK